MIEHFTAETPSARREFGESPGESSAFSRVFPVTSVVKPFSANSAPSAVRGSKHRQPTARPSPQSPQPPLNAPKISPQPPYSAPAPRPRSAPQSCPPNKPHPDCFPPLPPRLPRVPKPERSHSDGHRRQPETAQKWQACPPR